jgi:hypothetical protein
MRAIAVLIALGGCLVGTAAGAAMYGPSELDRDRARIAERIAEVHGILTSREHLGSDGAILARIPLLTPDAARNGDPMGFVAHDGRVYLPITGLKFLEDLAMAKAWRQLRERSPEAVGEYLAMLRWKPPSSWPDGHLLDPLEALGVPPGAWEQDAELLTLGTKLRNEAWAFLLAHQLGHVVHGHGRVGPRIDADERRADAFALGVLERLGAIPVGAVLYVEAATALSAPRDSGRGDDTALAPWQREPAAHAVDAARLSALARRVDRWADREGHGERERVLAGIADRLRGMAASLEEPAQRQMLAWRAAYGDPLTLAQR